MANEVCGIRVLGNPEARVTMRRDGDFLALSLPAEAPEEVVSVLALDVVGEPLVEQMIIQNAGNPVSLPMHMAEMIYGIRAVTNEETTITWVPASFLAEQEVRPWQDMPVWIPPQEGMQGFSRIDVSRAISAGMTFRPLAETAEDTLAWAEGWPEERKNAPLRFGLSAEREAEVLAAWHTSGRSNEE